MRAVRLRIMGRVQGVGFRDWTVSTGRALGLIGWVRNRADGSVETLAQGPETQVQQFVAVCGVGPTAAHVRHVEIEEISPNPGLAAEFVRLSTL